MILFSTAALAGNFGYSPSDSNQFRLNPSQQRQLRRHSRPDSLWPELFRSTAYDDLRQLSGNLSWIFKTGSHWVHRVSGMESRFLDTNGFPDFSFFETAQFNRAGFLDSPPTPPQGSVTAGLPVRSGKAIPTT